MIKYFCDACGKEQNPKDMRGTFIKEHRQIEVCKICYDAIKQAEYDKFYEIKNGFENELPKHS